jgi:beta-barrel assembly-enhancing protease
MGLDHRTPRRQILNRIVAIGVGLAIMPWLLAHPAPAAPALPSPADQKSVGEQSTAEVLSKYPQVQDGRLRFFREIGNRLVASLSPADRTTWDYKFYVLKSKEVNAFAVPGGHLFMFTGLYALLKTQDELAAVTGHELAHIYRQHWAKAYVKQVERQRVVAIGTLLAGNKAAALGWGAVIATVFRQKFSREEEDEADAYGLKDMVSAGYNPQGMVMLFQLFQAQGGEKAIPFLSDHPMTADRIAHTQERIAQMGSRTFPPLRPFNYQSLQ